MSALWWVLAALVLAAPAPSAATVRILVSRAGAGAPDAVRTGWWQQVDRRTGAGLGAASAVVPAVVLGGGVAVALAAGLAGGVGGFEVLALVGRRRAAERTRQVVTALEVLAAELVAGSREPDALHAAAAAGGPPAAPLEAAARLAQRGSDPGPALVADFTALASAWRLRAECGCALADVVASIAREASDRLDRRRAVDTAAAGSKASAGMLAGLPLLGGVMGAAMGAHPLAFLFGDPRGGLALLAGVGLEAGGWLWIGALITRATR